MVNARMDHERTPLIQTVIVTHREPRYPHSTLRRFCTICLSTLLILVVIGAIIPIAIYPGRHQRHDHDHHDDDRFHDPFGDWKMKPATWPKSQGISFDELQDILISTPDEEKVRSWSEYYSSGPHLAGQNLSMALWTREKWEAAGIKSEIVAYDVYLNYPVDHRLALYRDDEVEYECSLTEDIIDEDPTTSLEDRIPTFHGYSASGNVTGSYVYVNYGTFQDYKDLLNANISLEGKIALAKYGQNFRALKIKRAQELGMIGVVMYSDPGDDGDITEENGYKPYPDGPARQPSSVQRGSCQYIDVLPGDPTTPGYPSKPDAPRTNPEYSTPGIPSLPISYQDALPILKALNGYGPKASSLNERWEGGGLGYKGVEYNIGPTPDSITLNLFNQQDYVTTPIWNVIGIINGTIPDEVIVLGNHRDAWVAGGAGDPHSGSAPMIEVVRAFGNALDAGWKPLRTMVFASWDGEEYGLIGSTEWVEEYLPWLSSSTVAYLNVDVGARGEEFSAQAAPVLNSIIRSIADMVPSPAGGVVSDHWDGTIRTLGSGSDFTGFQDFAGISSMDLGFNRGLNGPVYHYHSNYDTFHWMDKYGDTTWKYHTTIAKFWALTAAKLVETPVLPLSATDYAFNLQDYLDTLKEVARNNSLSSTISFQKLEVATKRLIDASVKHDAEAAELASQLDVEIPWYKWWKYISLFLKIRKINTKYKLLERSFLYKGGLDGRSWFKHVVFAPGRYTGYAGARYPGLIESIEDKNVTNALRWSRIIEERLNHATTLLEG